MCANNIQWQWETSPQGIHLWSFWLIVNVFPESETVQESKFRLLIEKEKENTKRKQCLPKQYYY
jgi:hypothetical protein